MEMEMRVGTVTRVVSQKKLEVKVAGDTVAVQVSRMVDVNAGVGDLVLVFVQGPLMVVGGRL